MAENPNFKVAFAAYEKGKFTWHNPGIPDPDFTLPVLLTPMQKGILTVTDTDQTHPFIRDHEGGLRVLHLPEGFGALAFLLDRDQPSTVSIDPENPGSSYVHQSFYNTDYPISKTAHLVFGSLPFNLSIEGSYDARPVNWRRLLTHTGPREIQQTPT